MRRRGLAVGCALLGLAALTGESCGPFFAEAVFVGKLPATRAALVEGSPGIVWPEFGAANLAIVYRRLAGPAFTAEEKAQLLEKPADSAGSASDGANASPNLAGWAVWFQAVQRFTGQTADVPSGDPHVPGEDWESYENCLDDGFRTAVLTLDARVKEHGGDKAAVTDWLNGQNAVFSNCAGPEADRARLPAAANAPLWLKQDRAYQMAAAHFYRSEWDAAESGFEAIAADRDSPWHGIGAYMVARTLVRKAWLTKTDIGFDAASMTAARAQLQALIRAGADANGPARRLLNYVNLRVTPDEAAAALGDEIAKPDTHLHQDLIDLRYLDSRGIYLQDMDTARRSELMDWVFVAKNMVKDGGKHALERWRATKSVAWLTAAMMRAEKPEPDLMTAAAALPRSSPAWATVAYHRLRLAPDRAAARKLFAELLPDLKKHESLSTVNAFQSLVAGNADTLEEFVRLSAMTPAFDSLDGEQEVADADAVLTPPNAKSPTMAGLPVNSGERFTPEAATVLNEELPLETQVELVQKRELPPQLEFELAMAVWTRAVLLDKPELAAKLTPALIAGEKGWTPWVTAYDAAKTDDDRKAAALLALMRVPSVRPYVNAGDGREEGFVGYSEYRDNWWCAEMGYAPGSSNNFSGSSNYGAPYQQQPGQPVPKLDLPPFVTAAMFAQAQRESAALGQIGDAPAYFGREALAWVKAHPQQAGRPDLRGAEMLGFAFRAMRNGCNLEASTGLRREVFDLLHHRYPKSEWAARYPQFVDDPE